MCETYDECEHFWSVTHSQNLLTVVRPVIKKETDTTRDAILSQERFAPTPIFLTAGDSFASL
jgi:hypothetical protein